MAILAILFLHKRLPAVDLLSKNITQTAVLNNTHITDMLTAFKVHKILDLLTETFSIKLRILTNQNSFQEACKIYRPE